MTERDDGLLKAHQVKGELSEVIEHLRKLPCECDMGEGYTCRPHRWIKEMEVYRDMDELSGTAAINQALKDLAEWGYVFVDNPEIAREIADAANSMCKVRRFDVNVADTRWIVEKV